METNTAHIQQYFDPQDVWCNVYRDKHILIDNSDMKSGVIRAIPPYRNNSYCISFFILQGSMTVKVNGVELILRPNDYLTVMPCSTIEVFDSRCIFFSGTMLAHALFDLYEEVTFNVPMQKRAFCFLLYHLPVVYTNRLKEVYLMVKREMLRPDYQMKDKALRALSKLYVIVLKEAAKSMSESLTVPYEKPRHQQIFDRFIELLDIHYIRERSVQFYAKKLNISPKYLSMVSQSSVHASASIVINYYVTFRVKQLLYRGQLSVKQISEMLNFPTQSFFGRYFKRIVGCSPRKYMKMNSRNFNG